MIRWFGSLLFLGTALLVCRFPLRSQEPPIITISEEQSPAEPEGVSGVEVQARGPIHEAFATPTAEPKPTYGVPKRPPTPIEEMPPHEKPDGDVVWIGGYWAWDDDRADFLWISGCWRVKPDGRDWVPGYWREVSGQWQWVPGFWNAVQERRSAEVTYYPEPPPPPQIAAPPPPAEPDMFHVPGHWMWVGDHYVWRAGYHTRIRTGHVYVASHYRWTPFGFVFVPGYWDLTVSRRGVLYAPVVVNTVVVGPRFVYTPYYAVSDAIIVDAFFVRPGFCHYYFGDYYGPRYASIGFECGFHYSRRHYVPIVVYSRWEYRNSPGWYDTRISVTVARNTGRAPLPPRTLIQQNNVTINKTVIKNNVTNVTNVTNVYQGPVLASAKTVVAARGEKTVRLDATARKEEKESAVKLQKAALSERSKVESGPQEPNASKKPRTASLNLPATPSPAKALNAPGGGTKNSNLPGVTNVTRDPDGKRSIDKTPMTTKNPGANVTRERDGKMAGDPSPLTTKTPGSTEPFKVKAPVGTGTGTPPPAGNRPTITRPTKTPDAPAPTKKPPEEKKKKGG